MKASSAASSIASSAGSLRPFGAQDFQIDAGRAFQRAPAFDVKRKGVNRAFVIAKRRKARARIFMHDAAEPAVAAWAERRNAGKRRKTGGGSAEPART